MYYPRFHLAKNFPFPRFLKSEDCAGWTNKIRITCPRCIGRIDTYCTKIHYIEM